MGSETLMWQNARALRRIAHIGSLVLIAQFAGCEVNNSSLHPKHSSTTVAGSDLREIIRKADSRLTADKFSVEYLRRIKSAPTSLILMSIYVTRGYDGTRWAPRDSEHERMYVGFLAIGVYENEIVVAGNFVPPIPENLRPIITLAMTHGAYAFHVESSKESRDNIRKKIEGIPAWANTVSVQGTSFDGSRVELVDISDARGSFENIIVNPLYPEGTDVAPTTNENRHLGTVRDIFTSVWNAFLMGE